MRGRMGMSMAALAVTLSVAGVSAQAQTGYTLTTLKPASSAVPLDGTFTRWAIDANDRVLGTTSYFEGYVWLFSALAFRPRYTPYISRWPATTLSSVSPAKLVSATNSMATLSPNGQMLVTINAPALYDTVARATLGSLPQPNLIGLAVNNAGVVLTQVLSNFSVPIPGTAGVESFSVPHAHAWSVAQGLVALPESGGFDSTAWAVNSAGDIAGQVSLGERNVAQAVIWSGGQMQPIEQPVDTASVAFRINDRGQVLLRRAPVSNCGERRDLRVHCQVGPDTVYLRDNGVETALMPADVSKWISYAVLNNNGVVVGRYRTGTVSQLDVIQADRDDYGGGGESRAFIWQKGVLSDLTDWVKGKGVSLPAGAVLTRALAINDRGSVVAELTLASGATSLVRLTAR